MSIRRAADGSIERDDGTVLHFSIDRFVRQVCAGACCMICGRPRAEVTFNREHVLPDWLLRRFKLHDRAIRLPNQTGFTYGRYTVSCCVQCNDRMGTLMETPIREMVTSGYETLEKRLQGESPEVLFAWLAFLFLKTHLRDRTLWFNRDRRNPSPAIGELYEWRELHHIHCLARSIYTGAKFTSGTIGSLLVLPADTSAPLELFDYGDLYLGRTVLIRIDDICIVAALNDSCSSLTAYREELKIIKGNLSPLQLREIMVRIAYLNIRLRERPQFYSDIGPEGTVTLCSILPPSMEFEAGTADEFGALFYESIKDVLAGSANESEIANNVRSGELTFLRDDTGNFNARSMLFYGTGDT